jgi:uncharacterized membrane protein YeaQ/YmgE (transglycosylase-associated protein family)
MLGLIWTIVIGGGGAIVATYVGQALGWYLPGQGAGFIGSILVAVLILALHRAVRKA